ncbi:DapH/DapD/GlmU-related protein [Oribacterium sinus]|uniref:DapH/DapD/GlmU-related protein n=1 Tax=Oribacterium sinus TaxID=237576 RepID=UPI0028D1ED8E|nr:DapH/DapD/GlmU-related protein [Oribacterium sinus]
MAARYSGIVAKIWNWVNHFDYDKYWKMREYVCSHRAGLKAYYYLYKLKKIDSYHISSFGTHLGFSCAKFAGRPILPHGLNGVIIANDVSIGENCTIYHQVTIAGWNGGSPNIGDNVLFGAGCKVVGPVRIGNNVKIGAGCIVAIDIPDNATVVMEKPRIILQEDNNKESNYR